MEKRQHTETTSFTKKFRRDEKPNAMARALNLQ